MKVISRRENEGLVIGEEIVVTVLEVHSDHVRLAISCPGNMPEYWEQDLFCTSVEEQEPAELELTSHY